MTSYLLIAAGVLGFPVLMWLWHREGVKRALLEREQEEEKTERMVNIEANHDYEEKRKTVRSRAGSSVDPNDPWTGVR